MCYFYLFTFEKGHSFGGRVGLLLAMLKPDLFDKIVIVDSSPFIDKVSPTLKLTQKLYHWAIKILMPKTGTSYNCRVELGYNDHGYKRTNF